MRGFPWLRDQRGTTTVEFAVIAPLFFVLFLGIIELSLALYWWKTTEKAAQIGARYAIVRDLAASAVPATNARSATGVFGMACSDPSSPCVGFADQVCDAGGAGCDPAAFPEIVQRMEAIFPVIEPENVRITYRYTGLGYAGGPTIPAVTVELHDVPFRLGVLGLIGGLLGNPRALTTLPPIHATLTGEDLSSAAVG
jgi:TadE-like protein